MNRVRRVENQQELERLIDDFITRGYVLKSQGETGAWVKEKDWGDSGIHLFLLALTAWWTFGLSNALYAIYKRATAEEVHIRIINEPNESTAPFDSETAGGSTTGTSVTHGRSTTDRQERTSHHPSKSSDQTGSDESEWLPEGEAND